MESEPCSKVEFEMNYAYLKSDNKFDPVLLFK